MLILSRKEEESVVIGDNIKIKVVSVDKGSVKLGFEAPANLLILREELVKMVKDSNLQASSSVDPAELSRLHSKLKR